MKKAVYQFGPTLSYDLAAKNNLSSNINLTIKIIKKVKSFFLPSP